MSDVCFMWAGKAIALGLAVLTVALLWYWAINRLMAAVGWTWIAAELACTSKFWRRWFGLVHHDD